MKKTGALSQTQIRQQLKRFASRAYRRPATQDEVDRLVRLVALRRRAGRSALEAYGDALKAVLCSPAFLYLEERDASQLSSYALASRLSYFLWSTMPDRELRTLAAADKLRNRDVLRTQVLRMLRDPRSTAFVDGFLDSWLTLRDLGSMPPDRRQFRAYYHYDLKTAMKQETRLFTRHLIDKNLSIVNFLDSKFTFVNKALARHYGISPPSGPGFHRVELTDSRRGGLLGQASVLTVTANGIETSPVVRGVWLLENILGTPPTPASTGRRTARSRHPGSEDDTRPAEETPQRRQLQRLPSQDRPARLRAGKLRPHRPLARDLWAPAEDRRHRRNAGRAEVPRRARFQEDSVVAAGPVCQGADDETAGVWNRPATASAPASAD